jgi:hypothetical protein
MGMLVAYILAVVAIGVGGELGKVTHPRGFYRPGAALNNKRGVILYLVMEFLSTTV